MQFRAVEQSLNQLLKSSVTIFLYIFREKISLRKEKKIKVDPPKRIQLQVLLTTIITLLIQGEVAPQQDQGEEVPWEEVKVDEGTASRAKTTRRYPAS